MTDGVKGARDLEEEMTESERRSGEPRGIGEPVNEKEDQQEY